MTGIVNWVVMLIGTSILFVVWGWIPLERLDRYWSWNNPVGRPFFTTLVLTGIPALVARLIHTPYPGILIPITFLITQYAVLSGRFLKAEILIAGWVMVLTSACIWVMFFI